MDRHGGIALSKGFKWAHTGLTINGFLKKNKKMVEVKRLLYKPHPAKANIANAAVSHSKYKQ